MEIKELFNKILDSAHYPQIWNHGLIYSIDKNGDTKDPSNYRGITLTTTMDKNNEKNDKFYRKVAFLMYTEMVNFRPQS